MAPRRLSPAVLAALGLGASPAACACLSMEDTAENDDTGVGGCLEPYETGETGVGGCLEPYETGETGETDDTGDDTGAVGCLESDDTGEPDDTGDTAVGPCLDTDERGAEESVAPPPSVERWSGELAADIAERLRRRLRGPDR